MQFSLDELLNVIPKQEEEDKIKYNKPLAEILSMQKIASDAVAKYEDLIAQIEQRRAEQEKLSIGHADQLEYRKNLLANRKAQQERIAADSPEQQEADLLKHLKQQTRSLF